ncbi:MAG: nuclear transport factor 2 family protein [Alphaproteobacteria bacterium]|nr:nuclear transport factor 2 family protein [Alphaproteobacteria bacterium]
MQTAPRQISDERIFDELVARVKRLEDEKHILACMNRYMYLCDKIDADFNMDDLLALFTKDAIWEGIGKRYDKTFGRLTGRDEIVAMFAKYMKKPPHFTLNVHVLGNAQVDIDDKGGAGDIEADNIEADNIEAKGSWILVQTSTFASGLSWLNCARIRAGFRYEEEKWRICHFRTENLFSRPMEKAWDDNASLPVPKA